MYRGKRVVHDSSTENGGTGGAPQPQPPARPDSDPGGNKPLPDLPDPTEVGEDG
jgi:hypothetical protein